MGLKAELKQIVGLYNSVKKDTEDKIQAIKNDGRYSEEYKQDLIKAENGKLENHRIDLNNRAAEIVNKVKSRLVGSKKPIEKDLSFELRLNNTLKTIELAGKNMNTEELSQLVEPFKDDYVTMRSLFNIFRELGINTDGVIPVDGVESQINSIEALSKDFLDSLRHGDNMRMSISLAMIPDNIGEE